MRFDGDPPALFDALQRALEDYGDQRSNRDQDWVILTEEYIPRMNEALYQGSMSFGRSLSHAAEVLRMTLNRGRRLR